MWFRSQGDLIPSLGRDLGASYGRVTIAYVAAERLVSLGRPVIGDVRHNRNIPHTMTNTGLKIGVEKGHQDGDD